jgi:hypothetical protein
MNTGAFGQSGGLFKFYSKNVKKPVLHTVTPSFFHPIKHNASNLGHVL